MGRTQIGTTNGPGLNGSPRLVWQIPRDDKYIDPSGLAQQMGWINGDDRSE